MQFVSIIIAVVVLALIWWAYTQLIPMAKLQGNFATLVNVIVVVAMVCCVIWFVVLPLAAILFGMLSGGGFHVPR